MLLRKIVAARKYASFDVSLMRIGLSVNNLGNWFSNARIKTVNKIPNAADAITDTAIENFAAFGCPAPSSLDTRTLQEKSGCTLMKAAR